MPRINARIDEVDAEMLEYLVKQTGGNVTSVIREAVHRYYGDVQKRVSESRDALAQSGFIGCIEGEENLSVAYKAALTESLTAKTQ